MKYYILIMFRVGLISQPLTAQTDLNVIIVVDGVVPGAGLISDMSVRNAGGIYELEYLPGELLLVDPDRTLVTNDRDFKLRFTYFRQDKKRKGRVTYEVEVPRKYLYQEYLLIEIETKRRKGAEMIGYSVISPLGGLIWAE